MKNINELTLEEVEELESILSFKTNAGSTLYYSLISKINDEYLVYDGTRYNRDNVDFNIKDAYIGKLKYEIYIMNNSSIDVEAFIKEKAENTIKESLKDSIEEVLTDIINVKDRFNNKLNEELTNIQRIVRETDDTLFDTKAIHTKLKKFSDGVDLDSIESKVKDTVSNIRPLKDELKETLKSLRELIKE